MKIVPIPTSRVEKGVNTPMNKWILASLQKNHIDLQESDILVISSKIISYFEGRVITAEEASVENEADSIIGNTPLVQLTLKNGIYCANAGIDYSNVEEGYAVLWPEDPYLSAQQIQKQLQQQLGLQKLAVIITDSICIPGRRGTVSVAIGYSGIQGVQDLIGEKDAFGNTLRYSSLNIVDSLATAANLTMGESDECIPMTIICDYSWEPQVSTKKDEMNISPSDDMFPIG